MDREPTQEEVSKGLWVTVQCENCGQEHTLPLDETWTWEGVLPCGVETSLSLDPPGPVH